MSLIHKPLPALWLSAAILVGLSACGGEDQAARDAVPPQAESSARPELDTPPPPPPMVEPTGALNVSAALGTFEGQVSGLAFWHHPTLPQAGGVLAANGEAGLYLIPLSEGVSAAAEDGVYNGGVAASYGTGGTVIAAYEQGERSVRLLGVAPEGGSFTSLGTVPAPAQLTALCAAGRDIHAVASDGRAMVLRLTVEAGTAAGTFDALDLSEPVIDCAGSGTEAVFLTASGGVVDAGGAPVQGLAASFGAVDIALFSTQDGPVLVSLAGGRLRVGEETLAVTGLGLDQPEVIPTRIAGGSGNFGAVYRGGVLALLTPEGELSLAPWLGVAAAAPGLPGRTLSPLPEDMPGDAVPPLDLSVPQSLDRD